MLIKHIITESAAIELAKKLPSLNKHDYDTIDRLMRNVANKHRITHKALNDLFVRKYKVSPERWIKGKLDEGDDEEKDLNNDLLMQKFIKWSANKLNLQTIPEIEFSYDTEEAQEGHHTGRHTDGDNKVWVYAKNRNMVDILRTIAHELTHARQGELGMIKPGSSYPGSPIELLADMVAGKLIKIYGKKNRYIFQ